MGEQKPCPVAGCDGKTCAYFDPAGSTWRPEGCLARDPPPSLWRRLLKRLYKLRISMAWRVVAIEGPWCYRQNTRTGERQAYVMRDQQIRPKSQAGRDWLAHVSDVPPEDSWGLVPTGPMHGL